MRLLEPSAEPTLPLVSARFLKLLDFLVFFWKCFGVCATIALSRLIALPMLSTFPKQNSLSSGNSSVSPYSSRFTEHGKEKKVNMKSLQEK